MALATKDIKLTPQEYLDSELRSEIKHEYDDGYIVAMVGASRAHNLITLRLASLINRHLEGKPCRAYMADMKVQVRSKGKELFYYPDVMVSCDERPPSDYYEDKPILIIEVLSPTSETRDRLEKLAAYTSIPSLVEYFTVAQGTAEVDRYTMEGGQTILTRYQDGDTVELESIGLSIHIKDIYADVVGQVFVDGE